MKRKKTIKTLIFIFYFLLPSVSNAGDLTLGKEVANNICASCHGLDGQSSSGGNSALTPNITAQTKEYLIAKLKDYRSRKVDHPQMSLIADMLNDEDIENVSEWYSKIKITIELP